MKFINFTAIILLPIQLMLCACDTEDSSSGAPSATGSKTVTIAFDLVNSPGTGDRGHWGVHAWIMKGDTYIDTLEYYEDYNRYTDAGNAAKLWLNDGGEPVDGVSQATVNTDSGAGYKAHYVLSWDCRNFNRTKVPDGIYTVKVVVSRHTSLTPYGTLYTSMIQIGESASQSTLSLTESGANPDIFPYNVLENGLVEYKTE